MGSRGERGAVGALLQEIRSGRRWVLRLVTASDHKDVTRKLQETRSLNYSQGAASQMWRYGAARPARPPCQI